MHELHLLWLAQPHETRSPKLSTARVFELVSSVICVADRTEIADLRDLKGVYRQAWKMCDAVRSIDHALRF